MGCGMLDRRSRLSVLYALPLVVVLGLAGVAPAAGKAVPFKGSSAQQAVSAVPTPDPDVVFVTTVGGGNATHLGKFTFVSPHFSGLSDFSIGGTQEFTAANGDKLFADISGQLEFGISPDGRPTLSGPVAGAITGGTGRFEGATGSYTFSLVFDLQTLSSTGEIDGVIVRAK